MPALTIELRKNLERTIIEAREKAEDAARAALRRLAVDASKPFDEMTPAQKSMRRRLRARGRQAGDRRRPDESQEIDRLTEELAYESWHRMLFSRFLAENHLLMHPDGVPVSLAECEELAAHEGAPNGFVLAARYASTMLPQIFRIDDVLLEVEFPINDRLPLEKLLAGLPTATFTADDSLGWVYQFWQAKKKDEVNRSGQKIDGRTLPAVTQLFTEPYMVQFLLHNTLGAWWSAKNGIKPRMEHGSNTDEEPKILNGIDLCSIRVPSVAQLPNLEFLRWRDDGTPAAGTFEGWPRSLKEFTLLDPCCGSGHFLVAAFNLLVPMRMHEEGLSARDACDAVLRENLFGLELDPRCTQIAAFALALAAWTYPGEDGQPLGYRPLPPLNIACSGQGVVGSKEDWTRFANGDARTREGMDRLYDLFRKAPTLGSLIDPRTVAEDLFALGFDTLRGTVERALAKAETQADPDRAAVGVAAQGIALAASLMAREFTLVATNVPYLARGKQAEELRDYVADVHPAAKADLATAFVERCLDYCSTGGTTALVTPQNWLSLGSYSLLRERLLREETWNVMALLGPSAFQDMNWWAANTMLGIISNSTPSNSHEFVGIDVSQSRVTVEKPGLLIQENMHLVSQANQRNNPDYRLTIEDSYCHSLLSDFAITFEGMTTGDIERYIYNFWERGTVDSGWVNFIGCVTSFEEYGGRNQVLLWEDGCGSLVNSPGSYIKGEKAWGKTGLRISQTGRLVPTIYTGELFDKNGATLIAKRSDYLLPIYCYVQSPEYQTAVRKIDRSLKVTIGTLVKVPFDLDHWQQVAAEQYPDGLPEPHSDDPTQWLFKGHPKGSTDPLQVAVARLLGYRWPEQEPDDLDALADRDGIVPLPASRGERPAAERLLEVLRAAFGSDWSPAMLDRLLTDAGCKPGTSLDDWLRNHFFEQHCKRFHTRPFVWHVWDGRKDGFSCLLHYHRLTHKALETLTYSYLQDWITSQSAAARDGKIGADLRLQAAQSLQDTLKLILSGEPPHDLFIRWKPLDEQPLGWHPDLNDGVRLNIRPFVLADILRKKPTIKWTKDRGKEPPRDPDRFPWFQNNERLNDIHLTNAEKQAAREKFGDEPQRHRNIETKNG